MQRTLKRIALLMLLVACSGPQGSQRPAPGETGDPAASANPKRLSVAVMSDPKSLGPMGGPVPGRGELEGLLHAGLSVADLENGEPSCHITLGRSFQVALVDTLQVGESQVAHSIMDPGQAQYRDVEARLPRYDYDPARAASLMQELGYLRGPQGELRDARGQRLAIEFRAAPTDINMRSMLAVSDYWQRAGVEVTQVAIPPALQGDRAYRATFPAFEVLRNPNDLRLLPALHSSQIRRADNGWVGGYTGHHNPEYDALFERYEVTIPSGERLQVVGRLIEHVADQVVVMGLFYDVLPTAIARTVTGVVGTRVEGTGRMWSVFQWDVAR